MYDQSKTDRKIAQGYGRLCTISRRLIVKLHKVTEGYV